MIRIFLLKEIKETIYDFKFITFSVFSIVIIPLSFYLSYCDYEFRVNKYIEDNSNYLKTTKGHIDYDFNAIGYKPPAISNLFNEGMADKMPYKIATNNNSRYTLENLPSSNDPLTVLFGYLDYSQILGFIIPLFALFLSFNLINREIEQETLKLIIANAIPRYKIIIAKLLGNYFVFIVTILFSFILGILIVLLKSKFSIFSAELLNSAFLILLFTCLVSLVYFNLGLMFSVYIKQSFTSIIALLIIWLFFTIIIPKTSAILGDLIIPVKTENNLYEEIRIIEKDSEAKTQNEMKKILNSILQSHKEIDEETFLSDPVLIKEYESKITKPTNQISEDKNVAIRNLEQQYQNYTNRQNFLVKDIARISPMVCSQYIINDLTDLGYSQLLHLKKLAQNFQNKVEKDIYSKYIFKHYYFGDKVIITDKVVEGFDEDNLPIPVFEYVPLSRSSLLNNILLEMALLIFYMLLFFMIGYIRFVKMDITK